MGTLTFGIWLRIPVKLYYSELTRRFWKMERYYKKR